MVSRRPRPVDIPRRPLAVALRGCRRRQEEDVNGECCSCTGPLAAAWLRGFFFRWAYGLRWRGRASGLPGAPASGAKEEKPRIVSGECGLVCRSLELTFDSGRRRLVYAV